MTQKELKDIILTHVNLDPYRRALYEKFFEEVDDITVENFEKKYSEWVENCDGEKIFEQVRQEESDREDALIAIGMASIRNKDYTARNDPDAMSRFGLDDVRCNKTGLYGIITNEGEEVLPCIFESVNIHLDGYIEASFKGVQFDFWTVYREKGEKYEDCHDIIYYGKYGAIRLSIHRQADDIAQELAKLLGLEIKGKRYKKNID